MLGRNKTTVIEKDNRHIFRKKLSGNEADVLRRYNNLILWDKYCSKNEKIASPSILNKNDDDFVLDYEYVENGESLQTKYAVCSEEEAADLVKKAARMLAGINNTKLNVKATDPISFAEKNMFIAVDKDAYCLCSGGEIEFISILHHDKELMDMIRSNQEKFDNNGNYGLCHGDIRFDQFLVDEDNKLWITDFEECHYGNTSHDLAGLLGSILFDSLLNTFSYADSECVDSNGVDRKFMERGQKNMDKAGSLMKAAYEEYSKNVDFKVDLNEVSFRIGTFILERILSRAKFSFRMSAVDKAIAGVGKQAITNTSLIEEMILG